MIKAVLFDYGGTLVTPRESWQEVGNRATHSIYDLFSRNGLKSTFDQYQEFSTSTYQKYQKLESEQNKDIPDLIRYREIVDTLFQANPEAWRAKMASRVNELFWRAAVRNFAIRKEARACLGKLKSMNLQMAIVSNHHHPDALLRHLDRLHITQFFSCIFISASAGCRKPDQRIFNECLSQLGVRQQQAVFVGDSVEYDIEGARRVGIRSILVTDGLSPNQPAETGIRPDFTIGDLMEVPEIVSSL